MTTKDPTRPPVAGEPVEPTLRDRIALLVEKACRHDPKDNHTFDDDADRILAVVATARERKRRERPANPSRSDERGVFISHEPAATDWQRGFDAAVTWAESGDSDELAKLRAELADRKEGLQALVSVIDRDGGHAQLQDARPIDTVLRAQRSVLSLVAERDAEKARADRAELTVREEQEDNERLRDQREQAKARIEQLEKMQTASALLENSRVMAAEQANARIAELEAEVANERARSERLHEVDIAALATDNEALTKELAEAQEELLSAMTRIHDAAGADDVFRCHEIAGKWLDAHRAKPSPQSPSSADSDAPAQPTGETNATSNRRSVSPSPRELDVDEATSRSVDQEAGERRGADGSVLGAERSSEGTRPRDGSDDTGGAAKAGVQNREVATYETAPTLEKGVRPRRVSPLLRCAVTKNLCGTDTWMEGHDCQCGPCQQWLRVGFVAAADALSTRACTKSDQHDGPCNGFPRSTCHGFHAHQAEARRGSASLQSRVFAWAATTFGAEAVAPGERAARFVEEATELAQAEGVPLEKLLGIAQHVYSKEPGDPSQEAGGVGITLLAYCEAKGFSAAAALETEFARVQAIPADYFRKRHNAKADAGIAVRVPEGGTA